jgi:hypothetical protein
MNISESYPQMLPNQTNANQSDNGIRQCDCLTIHSRSKE